MPPWRLICAGSFLLSLFFFPKLSPTCTNWHSQNFSTFPHDMALDPMEMLLCRCPWRARKINASKNPKISPNLAPNCSTRPKCNVHWLWVPEWIKFRVCVLVYRCLNGTAPSYLAQNIWWMADIEGCCYLHLLATATLTVPPIWWSALASGHSLLPLYKHGTVCTTTKFDGVRQQMRENMLVWGRVRLRWPSIPVFPGQFGFLTTCPRKKSQFSGTPICPVFRLVSQICPDIDKLRHFTIQILILTCWSLILSV